MNETTPTKHAGLLIPFDMFRVSQLAAMFGELLVSKARNILDARLVLVRHAAAPLLLARIEGHVVGDDPVQFWRENADLVAAASQVLPRQVFLYYVEPGPPNKRREGFMVAQRGQVLAADDATFERLPPDATEADWPVSRLCQQLRISMEELAEGFPGGPRVEVKLVEPAVDDQALLMTLAGRPPEGDAPGAEGEPSAAPRPSAADAAEEDAKRRAREQAADDAEQEQRAAQVQNELAYTIDDLGLVVAPRAELSEPDLLAPYVVSRLEGDVPSGVPTRLTDGLQGKRIDIAVAVEFLSEVFLDAVPLSRPAFEERAEPVTVGDRELRRLEVLAPRLGHGTLLSTGKAHVFVSRRLGMPLPAELVLRLLDERA